MENEPGSSSSSALPVASTAEPPAPGPPSSFENNDNTPSSSTHDLTHTHDHDHTHTHDPDHDPDRALRVSQLDAQELDDGLVHMLRGKLTGALSAFSPSSESAYTPEIELVLKLLLYTLAVRSRTEKATPGMRLQNLKFGVRSGPGVGVAISTRLPNISPYLLLPLLTTLPTYLLNHLHSHTLRSRYPEYPPTSPQRRFWIFLERLGVLSKIWELAGGLWFLMDGRYVSLWARWVGVRLGTSRPLGEVTRSVSYEYMNRQLVWSGFTELLIFILPLVRGHSGSISAVVRTIRSNVDKGFRFLVSKQEETVYQPIRASGSGSSGSGSGQSGQGGEERLDDRRRRRAGRRGTYAGLPRRTCAICHHRLRDTLDGQLGLPAIPGFNSGVEGDQQDGSSVLAKLTGVQVDGDGDDEEDDNEVDNEETRIHLPAKTDCEDECRFCFYCISEVLTQRAKEVELEVKRRGGVGKRQGEGEGEVEGGGDETYKAKGWECLRCGEEVWGCMRIIE